MTKEELFKLNDRIFSECKSLLKAKNEDYSNGNEDALKYFKGSGEAINTGDLKVLWILMNKHYKAITSYVINEGKVESEPIESRIIDMINYLVILQALIEDKNGH